MNRPLIRITIAYILGITVAKAIDFPVLFSFLMIILFLGLSVSFILARKNIRFLILGLFLLTGLLNLQIRNLPPPKTDISHLPKNEHVTVIGVVDDEPRLIEDRIFFTLRVSQVGQQKTTGLVSIISKAGDFEYGDKVEISGKLEELESLSNPGILSYADYLKNKGISYQIRSSRSPPEVLARGGGNPLKRVSIALKNKLIVVPQKTLPEPYSTLLSSIVFGSRAAKASADIKETYKRAGVAHLLVASGMHLGILIGVCLFLVRSTRLPLWPGVLLTTMVNFLYAAMTGFGPSILRAAIMAEIMLVGLLFEREKEVYTSLALAAFIILLFSPKYLFEVGFQLSFAATWSLVYVAPVINERLKAFVPSSMSITLSAAMAPVLTSVPITLFHFSQASLVAVFTNVLLLPWVGVIVILGFVSTVLGAVFLPLGELVNGSNLVLLWVANRIVITLASLPFAQVFMPPPKLPLIIGYYAGLAGMVEVFRRGRFPELSKFRLMVICLAVIGILFLNAAFSNPSKGLIVTILDVGQGDSILIETPSGRKMLVDAGEKKMGERVVVPFLRKKGISKLDMVVLTHPHEDHVGGLPAVLDNIRVDTVLDPGFIYRSKSYQRFLDLIERNKIKYHLARAGQVIDFAQVKAQILHPTSAFLEGEDCNINSSSVVFRMHYGKFSMLFTGDNEKEGEERILESCINSLPSTILKVGHHGSRTSTSALFLEAVNPEIAVISCGKHNKFKHPHKATLEKLKGKGNFRTDRDGAIIIKSDGKRFSVKTSKTGEKNMLQLSRE